MEIVINRSIQDGKLKPTTGRIVIYKEFIELSTGPVRDHNDLSRALASKYKQSRDQVMSNSIRFYYERDGDKTIVCPVRKLDEDELLSRQDYYIDLIKSAIKM
ncbi:MAG: hypothetical protein LBH16_01430 [Treponema sp.]|jgi:hypothetical protein|nr:hypothetical protein [Treponema sp.]